ncbi:unnamed protein product [Cuscuta campestris]|uniref:Uncharacterized protein n=1 Tax=Cuscuta campestris TaxID=132261 RepID=A0A484LJQ4_9ASTE|nr:unnamed protein product [Cuscuta campestris]
MKKCGVYKMDVKRRLPQWMHCMPVADHEKKKSRTQDSSNGEEEDEAEVKKNFKPEDANDGRVKKKPRIKDSTNGGENAEDGLKKKPKTRHAKYGENIDRKAVKKEIKREDVKTEKLEKDKFRTQKSRDDEKDLKQEVDEGTQKSWRKTSLEDYNDYLETKNIDEAEPPPVRIHGAKAKHSVIEITDKNKCLPQTQDDEYSSEDEDLTADDLLTIARELTGNEEDACEALPHKPKTIPCLLGKDMIDLLLPPPSSKITR